MNIIDFLYSSITNHYWSLMVLVITSITCGMIGSFLVLRKLSMVSDAISHSVLLGIVLAFFITRDVTSPLLIIGAAVFGVITVFSIEMLSDTGLVKNDDAVGIVFPLFFALAVILITKFARNVHLDIDIVLMGEVIMAPLNKVTVFGMEIPKAFYHMIIVFVLNLGFITIFFKELKVSTFDKEYATLAGFSSMILFYGLMTLSSVTAVVAFDAVGAILVVSFLITPGASAYLITKDLKKMILVSCCYGILNSLLGFALAIWFNVSMSGMTATVAGFTFILTFLFNRNGMITSTILRIRRKRDLTYSMMIIHLGNHMGKSNEQEELGGESIVNHLSWTREKIEKISKVLIAKGLVYVDNERNVYRLTHEGMIKYDEIKQSYGV